MKRLLTDWSLMRFLRLLMAGIAAYNAAVFKDPFMGLIAVFFLYQVWANVSCGGFGVCERAVKSDTKQSMSGEISYKEVK